jgi:hypothetical protein
MFATAGEQGIADKGVHQLLRKVTELKNKVPSVVDVKGTINCRHVTAYTLYSFANINIKYKCHRNSCHRFCFLVLKTGVGEPSNISWLQTWLGLPLLVIKPRG